MLETWGLWDIWELGAVGWDFGSWVALHTAAITICLRSDVRREVWRPKWEKGHALVSMDAVTRLLLSPEADCRRLYKNGLEAAW